MITSADVLRKIKEISTKTVNAQHRIMLNDLLDEYVFSKDALFVLLVELEDKGLVKIHKTKVVSVSLTSQGTLGESEER